MAGSRAARESGDVSSVERSGACHTRRSRGSISCHQSVESRTVNLLFGNTTGALSPYMLGLEPVGSPTKRVSVFNFMRLTQFIAAEKVWRPIMVNNLPG